MFKTSDNSLFRGSYDFIFLPVNQQLTAVKHTSYKTEKLKRTSRLTVMLNEREMRALNIYCSRFRIKNKSEFLRETLMTAILKRFDEEHPSLFEEPDPTLFNRNGTK